ncbi:MAG: hypothetical protein O2954_18640 [bacterium]|nr:hypothetical protein [bacterium]
MCEGLEALARAHPVFRANFPEYSDRLEHWTDAARELAEELEVNP